MSRLLEEAIETVRRLPEGCQDALAGVMLVLAGDELRLLASLGEEVDLNVSLDQARRGEFASEEQIAGIWSKHGL